MMPPTRPAPALPSTPGSNPGPEPGDPPSHAAGRIRPGRRRRVAALVFGSSILASACSIGGGSDEADPGEVGGNEPASADESDSDPGDGGGGTVGGELVFAEETCRFTVPSGSTPRCGTVRVPENWETGEGTVDLAVAVFSSTADDPAPDPVVYLEGGPGGHALDTVRFLSSELLEPLQDRGDVVFFDQRGAGLSMPRLGCDEITTLSRELEDTPGLADEEVERRFAQTLADCRSRLEGEGIDVSAYNSAASARDVEAIRLALGYEEWNLLGISYGTRLGLEVMRAHPRGVRSVVLDSVFPPEVDSTLDNPRTFVEAYEAVVAACAEEPACQAGGDLDERFASVVASYEADPVRVEVQDFLTGETDQVYVEGETVIGLVAQALYSPEQFTDLPELVSELERSETEALELFLSQQRTNEAFFSSGMFYAFECNEEIPFAEEAEVAASLPPDPFGLQEVFDYASNNGTNAFATCDAFGLGQPDPLANEPVVSEIPALVMAGRFDPVTPVSWAEQAAANLANSHLVVAPARSHGVSPGACGMEIVREFLDEPGAGPDTTCFDDEELRFVGPPDGEIVLEPIRYPSIDASLTIETMRPRDWVHSSDLEGDSFRQASFLDPTELVQLAGNDMLLDNLEFFFDDSQGITLLGPALSVERGGHTWEYRSGRNSSRVVEWYETEINGHATVVILVAAAAEVEALVAEVVEPALESIEVTG